MPKIIAVRISCFLALITFSFLPSFADAVSFTVSKSCGTTVDCFATISEALTRATTTLDSIVVQPGTYTESGTLSLINNVDILGVETARTIIQKTGTGVLFDATNVSNVQISRLTIINASTGLLVGNSSNIIKITNNIFWNNAIAVQFTGTSSGEVTNNTFFDNTTAISSTVNIPITDNIFSGNNTALSAVNPLTTFSAANVTFNLFHNGNVGSFTIDPTNPAETNIPSNNAGRTNADPSFVKSDVPPPNMDLHLQDGSGAIGTGTGDGEIGAFGGTGADNIPFPVTISDDNTKPVSATSIQVTWEPNNAYNIASYNVQYKFSTENQYTKVNVPVPDTSRLISGLTGTASPPETPVLNPVEYADRKLILSWSPVPNATGYKVHVFDSTKPAENPPIDVGNTVFFIIDGLVNGREYGINVSAYSQASYKLAVTAVDDNANESTITQTKTVSVGGAVEGLRSSPTQTEYPDRIVGAPDLPDKGCFVATAAYGYYSAPQVQVLRTFRDRYLITNRAGRAFVDWYYRYGPKGAEFLNSHPWSKLVVRAALLPIVGSAWFMTKTPFSARIVILFLIVTAISYTFARRKFLKSGRQH